MRSIILKTGVCLAAVTWPFLAQAQTTPTETSVASGQAQATDAPSDAGDIVVTAQKRTQRLQDVPISVAVLGGEALQDKGIHNLQDLKGALPGIQILPAGPTSRLFVRGIGSGDNAGFDQAVATFIDDVYHGRSRGTASGLFDIERSEFLKGPQSTFFGNSAIAGAVNVTTAKPTDTLQGYAYGSYNFNFDQYVVEGAVSGPITPTLSGRLSVLLGSGDGWVADTTAGGKIPETNDRAVRVQLKWEPDDRLSAVLKGEAGRFNQRGGLLGQITQCPPVLATPTQDGFARPGVYCAQALANGDDVVFNSRRSTNAGSHANLSNQEVALTANYDLGAATLTSTTAYLRYNYKSVWDLDFTSTNSAYSGLPEKYDQFSQELRIASGDTGLLNYTVGAYFQSDHLTGRTDLGYYFLNPPIVQALTYDQHEKIYAGFASLGLNLTEKLTITGGLRAQRVEKRLLKGIYYGAPTGFADVAPIETAAYNATGVAFNLGPAGQWRYSDSYSKLVPSANIRYKFSPDLMAYASYANGFKAGGFNMAASGPVDPATGQQIGVAFQPEKVDAFEIGFKSRLFDRRLTLNVTAFTSRYSNLQVGGNRQTVNGPVNVVSNAASSVSKGIEVEADLRVTGGLTTGLQLSLLDAHYKSFPGALPTACQQIVGQCVFGSTAPGATVQDLSGKPTAYSPSYSGLWTVDYETPISDNFRLALGSQLSFTDHFQVAVNNDPNTEQDAYVQLDLSAKLISGPGQWEVGLIAKNVNDVKTFHWATGLPRSPGSFIVARDQPRSFTVQFRKTF